MKKFLNAVITKVDETKREVTGVLAEEAVDKDDEIFDFASSVPYFKKWNADFAEKTDGKSVGNLRAMHKAIAAGKFLNMEYDTVGKMILVTAKVTDDKEWNSVIEGVYTGFSIGARVVGKKWKDAELNAFRYTADPFEGSLVDNPCMYGAVFTSVKADGTSEVRKLKGGIVKKFASKLKADELIKEAKAVAFDVSHDETVAKGLYTVAYFAQLCASLNDLATSIEFEADYEGDNSAIPEQIRACAIELGDLLVDYCEEEVAEENGGSADEVIEMSDKPKVTSEPGMRPKVIKDGNRLRPADPNDRAPEKKVAAVAAPAVPAVEAPAAVTEKAGAKHSKETRTRLSEMRTQVSAFVTEIDAMLSESTEEATATEVVTAADAPATPIVKVVEIDKVTISKADHEATLAKVDTLTKENASLCLAVEELSKRPVPTAVKINGVVVEKKADLGNTENTTPEAPKTPLEAVKLAQASPRRMV